MKVLFLDIDGVLNHNKFYQNRSNTKLVHDNYPYNEFDPISVSHLNKILDETDAKLVVSSSWRVDSNLQDTFKEVGIRHKIYGITPWLIGKNIHRGDEINEYIVNNGNVEKYCILDDIDDFHENQKPFFIKCKAYEDGLNLETANKAIEILNS